jgi:hypothetical protein
LSGLGTMESYRPRIANLSEKLSNSISNRSTGVDYLFRGIIGPIPAESLMQRPEVF